MKQHVQRFAGGARPYPAGTENPGAGGYPVPREDGEEKARQFQELIDGPFREEFEAAVGQRIQAAIQQRFRSRTESGGRSNGGEQDGENTALRRHFQRLVREGEELRRLFPDFDLMEEMRNPAFVRLTAPGTGVSVKDAFYAVHGEDIQRESMEYAARQAGDRIAASVQAGASRPLENGVQAITPTDMAVDVRTMDRRAREEYRRRIRNGETIDFASKL